MGTMASQITSLTIVYSAVYSGADPRKHQSSASLAFVWGIHRGPVNSPHKWPVTRKMFPFDDVIIQITEFLCCPLFLVMGLGKIPNFINLKNKFIKELIFCQKQFDEMMPVVIYFTCLMNSLHQNSYFANFLSKCTKSVQIQWDVVS